MDEKIPPGGGRPPLSIRAVKLVPLFLGDEFRIRQRVSNSQAFFVEANSISEANSCIAKMIILRLLEQRH